MELLSNPDLEQCESLAKDFAAAYSVGDPEALQRLSRLYNLKQTISLEELRGGVQRRLSRFSKSDFPRDALSFASAQLLVSQSYGFATWQALIEYIEAINGPDSPIAKFESAVEAVITGDLTALQTLLRENPELIRARSSREHGATLLHYVSANGVEDFRQKTPKNAVDVARLLINAGAEVDADLAYGASPRLRELYPERFGSTTLGLVATSIHPAEAGVQIALMQTLLDAGASLDGIREGWGFFNEDGSLKSTATKPQLESGFMWACEYGHTNVVEFILDKGFDPGTLAHGMTGLHWAMVGGHLDTIRLLLDRNAPLEIENCYGGAVLSCAIWAVSNSGPVGRWPESNTDWVAIIQSLIDAGAKLYETDIDFPTGNQAVDDLLRGHGMKP